MASVYVSYDNGSNWTELTGGDAWPSTAGVHVVRKYIPRPTSVVHRMRLKITSTDDDTWGVRAINLYVAPREQEVPRG